MKRVMIIATTILLGSCGGSERIENEQLKLQDKITEIVSKNSSRSTTGGEILSETELGETRKEIYSGDSRTEVLFEGTGAETKVSFVHHRIDMRESWIRAPIWEDAYRLGFQYEGSSKESDSSEDGWALLTDVDILIRSDVTLSLWCKEEVTPCVTHLGTDNKSFGVGGVMANSGAAQRLKVKFEELAQYAD